MKNSRIVLALIALAALAATGFSVAGAKTEKAEDCCSTGGGCCESGGSCCGS